MSNARKHRIAKRFMFVFAIVLFAGIVVESVRQSQSQPPQRADAWDLLFIVGLVGFLASALIAREKNIAEKNIAEVAKESVKAIAKVATAFVNGLFALAGGIIAIVFYVAVALGMLWGLIAIVKWMWVHS